MSDYWDDEEEEDPQIEETARIRTARRTRRASDGQSNWYLLTGLVIGLAIGLLVSLVLSPVKYVDTDPSTLSANYKDEYRRIIALAYRTDGNLDRARARASLVDQDGSIQALASQAQRMLAENLPAQEARALAVLAADIGRGSAQPVGQASTPESVDGTAVEVTEPVAETALLPETPAGEAVTQEPVAAVQTPTALLPTATPTPTRTPPPTFTPRPTATPIPVQGAPFTLKSQREVCDGSVPAGLLQIEVSGADGRPMPGVRVLVTWQDGEDIFYTGLVPQVSPGYADFLMTTGIPYNLRVGEASEPLDGIKSSGSCGWKLEFTQESGG